MNHLHVVACAGRANPIAAWLAVGLRGSLLEDLLDRRPRLSRTAGHERGAVTGTLLTAGNTRADKEKALGLELLRAADRVGVVRVTTVNDDVALLEVRYELLDESVDSRTGLDEEDDLARALELRNELLNGPGTLDLGPYMQ